MNNFKKKRYKIIIFAPKIYPLLAENHIENQGGMDVYFKNLIDGFTKYSDFELNVFLLKRTIKSDLKLNSTIVNNMKVNFTTIPDYGVWSKNIFHKIFSYLYFLICIIKCKPDVFIKAGIEYPIDFLLLLYSKFFNTKLKSIMISSTATEYREATDFKNKVRQKITKKILKSMDVSIICQNNQQFNEAQKFIDKNNLLIINNIFSPRKKIDTTTTIENSHFILWVGRGEYVKNPSAFLELSKKLNPQIKKIMICMQQHDQNITKAIDYKLLVEDSKEIPNFTLLSYVEEAVIQQYFKKSALLVNTSFSEGFPMTFLESMCESKPIFSLFVDPDGIIMKHNLGFCSYGDMNLLKENIEKYILEEHKVMANHLFTSATKTYFKNNFGLKTNMQKYIDLIQNIC
ncbi:MAG: glycosyltransferase [Oligoflexia bacterium]|nr:glycosyltransferase [Oligoflexia bacterium]